MLADGYKRIYSSKQEFLDHAEGRPVQVGLIPHLAKWYRLPFGEKFFVLGESHTTVNYRALIEESNQTGKYLGEGGSVPIKHYAVATEPREELANPEGVGKELMMESILAKTLYAMTDMLDRLTKPPPQETAPKKPKGKVLAPEPWLNQAKQKKPVERDPVTYRPYYMNADARVSPKKPVKEAGYKRSVTAAALPEKCLEAINDFAAAEGARHPPEDAQPYELPSELAKLRSSLTPLIAALNGKAENDALIKSLQTAIVDGNAAAQWEVQQSDFANSAEFSQGHPKEGAALAGLPEACAMRDMFKAIVDANKDGGYVMAGVGDNHLQHLAVPLKQAKIPAISFKDFMTKHSQDAF